MSDLQELRKAISKDMDERLELHSETWDYAKELLIRIDAISEAKRMEKMKEESTHETS